MKKISITGARVIDPDSKLDEVTDIHVEEGCIAAVGSAPKGFKPDIKIDATNQLVIPGLVDLAARLREPGLKYRANMETELAAATHGGVTTLCTPPDTDPVLDEPGLVEMLRHRARQLDGTRVFPLGALTVGLKGEVITEMAQLTAAGCVGLSQPSRLPADTHALLRAMQYASTFDFTVWLHPQDAFLGRDGVAHGGAVASRLGLSTVPASTEAIALHTIFELVAQTDCRVHLCRLSSATGVELVRRAKADGLPVTADVAIHHLHLTDLDIGHFDSRLRVDPPFRGQRDRDALRAGVADGTIDAVCSDHTPVDDDDKIAPFASAEPGTTALELLLPLVLKWADQSDVTLAEALAAVTCRAAKILGVAAGSLKKGAAADICVVDPVKPWIVSEKTLQSACHHSPFSDSELQGCVTKVLIGGVPIDLVAA